MENDIKEMFRVKNREILINNLKYDLDKNINSLIDTITNIFNLEFDTAIRKIISIFNDSEKNDVDKIVTDIINSMKLDNFNDIENFISIKKEKVLNKIDLLEFTEDEMNNYYELVFNSTKELKEKLRNEFDDVLKNNLSKFNEYVLNNIDSKYCDLTINRINDYLTNRLYGKLETKIHMEIMLRDNNLINKAKESYLRYQEITNKTIKN